MSSSTSSAHFDLSRTGLLVYLPASGSIGDLMLVDRSGSARAVADRRAWHFPRFAPSGSRAAVGIGSGNANTREGDLWSVDIATGVKLRVTSDGSSSRPAWTPDGESLLFSRRAAGRQVLARVAGDGTAPPTTLLDQPGGVFEAGLTADGGTLVWRQDTPGTGTGRDILAMPVDTPSAARPVLQTRFDERGIAVGPVGDWLAYVSNESGRNEVYLRRLAPGSRRWPISRNGGTEPRWTRSGEVFFRKADSVFVARVALGASPTDAPRIAEPTLLFTGRYQMLGFEPTWDAAPDGRTFLMVSTAGDAGPAVMLYANWIERWKRAALGAAR